MYEAAILGMNASPSFTVLSVSRAGMMHYPAIGCSRERLF
jgi:hypothetical protein